MILSRLERPSALYMDDAVQTNTSTSVVEDHRCKTNDNAVYLSRALSKLSGSGTDLISLILFYFEFFLFF